MFELFLVLVKVLLFILGAYGTFKIFNGGSWFKRPFFYSGVLAAIWISIVAFTFHEFSLRNSIAQEMKPPTQEVKMEPKIYKPNPDLISTNRGIDKAALLEQSRKDTEARKNSFKKIEGLGTNQTSTATNAVTNATAEVEN